MSKKLVLVLGLGLVGLAGCTQGINPTDTDRAIIGAGVGATAAHLGGHNVLKGAAIGGAALGAATDNNIAQTAIVGGVAGALAGNAGYCG